MKMEKSFSPNINDDADYFETLAAKTYFISQS